MADLLLRALIKAGHALNNPFAMNQGYILPRHGDGRRDWQRVAGFKRFKKDRKQGAQGAWPVSKLVFMLGKVRLPCHTPQQMRLCCLLSRLSVFNRLRLDE